MTKLERLEKKLRSYTPEKQLSDILGIIREKENLAFLVDLNTTQLMQGKDYEGVLLGPPYRSPAYAEYKLFLNPLGVVDLFLTGKFHRSIFVKASSFPLLFDARDSKKDMLINKYGKVLGASEESKTTFNLHILPEVRSYYTRILQL